MESAKAFIAHQTKERLRLRLPEHKNQPSNFANWQHAIEQWPDIQLVEVNPATASLLIHHESNTTSLLEQLTKLGIKVTSNIEKVAERAASTDLMPREQQGAMPLWKPITDQLELVNKKLSQVTGGTIDLPSLLFIALLLQGLIQFIRRPALIMPWDTAWWFALNVYMMIRNQEAKPSEC